MSAITDFLNQDGLNTLWSKIKTYISNNTVAKETGKGLSTNDFTAAYKKLLDSIDSTVGNTSNLVKNSAVNKAISDLKTQIGNLKTFNIKVVTELPTSGQESNVIYLIKHIKSTTDTSSAHTGATNIRTGAAETYDEYLWIAGDGKFEKIGNTDIDLSAYAKTVDVKKQLDSKLSIDTDNAKNYPYGYYSGNGKIKLASELFNSTYGIFFEDHGDGSMDVTVDLTDPGIVGPLSIDKGGTGATDSATAAKNLKVLSLTGGYDLPECKGGNSIVTDATQLITSWAYNGFEGTDSTSKGTLYKRDISEVAHYMQNKLAVATPTSKGFMSAADKAKLDGLGSGTKLTYTWDSNTRKIVVSGITLSKYKFYYRTSVGILKEIAPSGSTLTIPTDASSVIEVYCVNNSSNNKSLILI